MREYIDQIEFEKRIYKLTDKIQIVGKYINKSTNIECHCKICGHIWYPIPYNLLSGEINCPCCIGRVAEKGVNSMWDTNPEEAKLLLNPDDGYKYTKCSKKELFWICPNCGNIINRSPEKVYTKGLACRRCSDGVSYPNKLMYALLKQVMVSFETEKCFEWCKYKYKGKKKSGRYDFYIPSKQLIIEMDGGIGHGNKNIKYVTAKESKYMDDEKDRLAKEHDIGIIRIDCRKSELEYIKTNILSSQLTKIFDLSKINWTLCNQSALRSLTMIACSYWNDGLRNTTKIGKLMHLNRVSIVRYLKKCAISGLCDYDPHEAMSETAKNGKNHTSKVRCIETGEIFESISKAKQKYHSTNISACCLKQRNTSGCINNVPLHWEYIGTYANYGMSCKSIPVYQYNLNGVLMCKYKSIHEAEKRTGINRKGIVNTCKGRYKTSGGFIWRYADEIKKFA